MGAPLAAYHYGVSALPLITFLAFAACAVTFIGARGIESNPMPNMAISMLGIVWIGIMGAYGAALTALESFNTAKADLARVPVPLAQLARVPTFTTKRTFCRGCDNRCSVGARAFEGGGGFFTGRKC